MLAVLAKDAGEALREITTVEVFADDLLDDELNSVRLFQSRRSGQARRFWRHTPSSPQPHRNSTTVVGSGIVEILTLSM
jgi:hypothetical protein